jgi:rSAM/selenodomain-associated transferase 1
MGNNSRLLLFTRYPEAGKTKTRLIRELGAQGAAMLQKRLTERVVSQANLLWQRLAIATIVYFVGGSRKKMTSWLGQMHYIAQADGDLGERMHAAFQHAFAEGAEIAVLIGSDIPDISFDLLQQAFTALLTREVVIGPSEDGGYYLLGLCANKASKLLPLLFTEMPWSTGELFAATLSRLDKAGYSVATLPPLRDIDLPIDLPFARERDLL